MKDTKAIYGVMDADLQCLGNQTVNKELRGNHDKV